MRHPQENAEALYKVAAEQGGYFTAAQAREAGYAYSQQHYHRTRGHWQRIDRGIFRLRDFPPGEREDLIRWSLWSRDQKGVPQAVVSHETALTVHELSDVMPAYVHLTVPRGFRKRVPAGCVLHLATLTEGEMQVVRSEFKNETEAVKSLILNNTQKTNLEVAIWDYVKNNV